jgi:hypothetical protein
LEDRCAAIISLEPFFLKKKKKKKKNKAGRKVSGGVGSSEVIAMLIDDRNPTW